MYFVNMGFILAFLMFFLGLGFLNFSDFCFFCLIFFFLFFYFFSFSGGSFIFFDSSFFVFLCFMSIMIFLIILSSEKNFVLKFLSFSLVVLSFFFFLPGNFFLLFFFFELSVFPIILMILGYGNQIEKIASSYYLLLYSVLCSSPVVLILFGLDFFSFTVSLSFFFSWEIFFFLNIFFLMKFPVYFLHFWLPKAHVEAPTSASMILAGLLLKFGTAGYFRILGLVNGFSIFFLLLIGFFGMLISSFLCVVQSDLKSLAAYSSINHMSFFFFVLVLSSFIGCFGGVLILVSHGFISTLMFFLIGEFYHFSSTRIYYFLGGFFFSDLALIFVFSLVLLFNCGVPISLSFFGEFFGLCVVFFSCLFFFFFMLLFFFMSFYYSIYLMVSGFLSKTIDVFCSYSFLSSWWMLLGNMNLLIFFIFF